MTVYSTVADMVTMLTKGEVARVSTRNLYANDIDSEKVDAALVAAGATIDRALIERYSIPIPGALQNTILNRISCRIAHAELDAGYRQSITDLRNQALAELEQIRTGQLGLGLDEDNIPIVASRNTVGLISPPKVFTRQSLFDYANPFYRRRYR